MPEKIVLNHHPSEKRNTAIQNEIERFEKHTKNLSDKATDIIESLKNSLITTKEEGLNPIYDSSAEGINKEKLFIQEAINLLEKDIFRIDIWSKQSLELKKQIKDIVYQLEEEKSSIDHRLRRMQSPYLGKPDIVKDIDTSKTIGRPLLVTGENGIGKRSLIYAFGVEYNHRVIRLHITKNTRADNLYFEIDQSAEHVIFGPLGHAVMELGKWQSKADKLDTFGSGDYEDDPIPIVMIEGLENTDQETMEKILSELEHDRMSFNVGDFDRDYASHIRPFVIVNHHIESSNIPFHTLSQCYPIEISFPDKQNLYEIAKLHYESLDESVLQKMVDEIFLYRENRAAQKFTLRDSIRAFHHVYSENLKSDDIKDSIFDL